MSEHEREERRESDEERRRREAEGEPGDAPQSPTQPVPGEQGGTDKDEDEE